MKVVICSGYFDPLHVGHIDYLNKARELTEDILVVIVNNDIQALNKNGKYMFNELDRLTILNNLAVVDEVFISIDKDETVNLSLTKLRELFSSDELIFAKGGDRNIHNIPELDTCNKLHIVIIDNLGYKIRNSHDYRL